MTYKVFMKIFFEKPKYFMIYGLMMTTFWYVLFIDISDSMFTVYYEKRTPDIEISGQPSDRGNLLYENIDSSSFDYVNNTHAKIYGLMVRNFYTFSDANYQVSYRIYGADNSFLNNLGDYLKKGRLPEDGKREAVIGNNMAKYLNVKVGDALKVPLMPDGDDTEEYEYIISGILQGDMSFYGDGLYVPEPSLYSSYQGADSNVLYVFTEDDSTYRSILDQLQKSGKSADITVHRQIKGILKETMAESLIKTIPFSTVFLLALFISLMKDIDKKMGLMKALGLSDGHIMGILAKGFGVFNLGGILNSFVAMGCIRLVSGNPLPVSVFLYTVCSYGLIWIVTIAILFFICKRTLPKKAMALY